ncbi:acyl-CoA dehydrogenase family protein [Micromonospora ureilytica]|uniref:acyl-CoA dehydrogenase family protein n=1 Tax=Micromonospora ureilytica TaxID=709868 RepID=UPI002E0D2E05|nr:acyl-CoA dehydrogenase family protein [Micromonospora ureilytica]
MKLGFTPAEEAFRREIRVELASPDITTHLKLLADSDEAEPEVRPLYRALGERRLLAVNWAEEHGGRGLGLVEAAIVAEELARAGVPDTLHVNTIQIVGLFLQRAGTVEQQAEFLPSLAAGLQFASVLYTEPEAGSDLASIRTTAVPDGDGYRLDGVKVYNLKSDVTDIALCAARIDDGGNRYRGIRLFLVDMHAEGLTREIIPCLADEQFHRVRLEGVHVSTDRIIGIGEDGWTLITRALSMERTGLDYSLKAEKWYSAALTGMDLEPHLAAVGRYGAAVEATRLHAWQLINALAVHPEGAGDGAAAAAKYVTSELAADLAVWANLVHHDAHTTCPATTRMLEAAYREAPGLTFSAGTSEVMLQIVAASDTLSADTDFTSVESALAKQLRKAVRDCLQEATQGLRPDVRTPLPTAGEGCPSWAPLVELGVPAFEAPADAGGLDLGLQASLVVCEELGRALLRGPHSGVTLTIDALRTSSTAARAGLLEPLIAGTLTVDTGMFALDRPMSAEAIEGGWRVHGSMAIDGGQVTHLLIPLLTDGTVALALVPTTRPGWHAIDGDQPLATFHGLVVDAGEVIAVTSPEDRLALVARARVRQAAYLLGLAGGAHDAARAYTQERRQFERPIHDFQAVAFGLAEAATSLETAWVAVRRAGWLSDEGRPTTRASLDALALAAEATLNTTRTALHVCGARGLTADVSVHRHYRLARTEAVRYGSPLRLWCAAARQRLERRDGLELITDPWLVSTEGLPTPLPKSDEETEET